MDEQVLLVDCEPNRARLLQRKLERYGLVVRSANSLVEAMAGGELSPRVMVVDLGLLCGPQRSSLAELVERVLAGRVYSCPHCGRSVREVEAGSRPADVPVCCGAAMQVTDATVPEGGKVSASC